MMDARESPDNILRKIQQEEKKARQGKLKIFFGYAAGVGKTYAMLEAAHEELAKGTDVVAGYIEPHARPETVALVRGLEVLPPLTVPYKEMQLKEFDIDGAIRRKPQLILVDELAHTNAQGCRHEKRYQDIQELLRAGINVYTTINVQHIESLNDIVASITKVIVRERIPDYVFDDADQVELVDIEPADLVKRLTDGKIYAQAQVGRALQHFFIADNLTALREIALRRMADRVNKISLRTKNEKKDDYYTKEHILVCLSSSPSNPKIIRTAARMADAFDARFTALFVRTSGFDATSKENRDRLEQNMHLAELLGAKIETVVGENVPFQIAEFARMSGVSQLVVGRSNTKSGLFHLMQKSFTDQLLVYLPKIDVHVIPDSNTPVLRLNFMHRSRQRRESFHLKDTGITLLIFAITTAISLAFDSWELTDIAIIPLYLIGVLIDALKTTDRFHSILLAILNILTFDFLFIEPRHTLSAYDPSYGITFVILFVAAVIAGELANKVKIQAVQAAQLAYRMRLLLETSQMMQKATSDTDVEKIMADQLVKLLNRDIVYYHVDHVQNIGRLMAPIVYEASGHFKEKEALTSPNEQAVALWVYKNRKRAGASTETLGDAKCLYLPVRSGDDVYGVVGMAAQQHHVESNEVNLALSILTEGSLALEKELYNKKRQEMYLQARNEQLRSNLLRSISHDLRTPLTSISGNADFLLNNSDKLSDQQKRSMYAGIYDDSMWLINLVENILSVTRIENGTIQIHKQNELLDDIVYEALKHVNQRRRNHNIRFEAPAEILIVVGDARLLAQVLINLIDNAVKYTPEGSEILIKARKKADKIEVTVADTGAGIPNDEKKRIFEMFYTAERSAADSRRGMGIGLSLCQSIIRAHGGTIYVKDNVPHGTLFVFTLPAKEI